MTSISKNVYTDKLINIVHAYNNTYHRSIKIKPFDVNSSTYINFGIENNNKNPKDLLNTVQNNSAKLFSLYDHKIICYINLFLVSLHNLLKVKLVYGILKECQKKLLNLHLQKTIVFIQKLFINMDMQEEKVIKSV